MAAKSDSSAKWDLFISHASEDKNSIARPLEKALREQGCTVWFDEAELTLGDSLRQKIDEGLANSRFGVVILSAAFFAKKWPKDELDGLVARESDGEKVILPIWHDLNQRQVSEHSPILAGRLAASSSDGISELVRKILKALKRAPVERSALENSAAELVEHPTGPNENRFSSSASQLVEWLDQHDDSVIPGKFFNLEKIALDLGVSLEDCEDSARELEDIGMAKVQRMAGRRIIVATTQLTPLGIANRQDYDPASDDLIVAASIHNAGGQLTGPAIASSANLSPARVNRAVLRLEQAGRVDTVRTFGSAPFVFHHVATNHRARQFLRDNNLI